MLEGFTISRTIRIGWLYLAIGIGVSVLLTVELLSVPKARLVFPTTFPLEIPLFAVLASTGGLMTFASDRTKGVLEYLLAYGLNPRMLFTNALLATTALVTIVLGAALSIGIGGALAEGVPVNWALEEPILLYTIPMAYAGALFCSTGGMIWSSLSTPRSGINSPVGIAPLIGVAPTILVLLAAETAPSSDYYYITAGASVAIVAIVVVLLAMSARLMGRERFLSPL